MGAQIEDERVERMEERLPRYPRETLPRVCTRGVEISSTDREVYGYAAATAACIRFGYGMRRSILSRRCRVKTCKRTAAANAQQQHAWVLHSAGRTLDVENRFVLGTYFWTTPHTNTMRSAQRSGRKRASGGAVQCVNGLDGGVGAPCGGRRRFRSSSRPVHSNFISQ